MKTLSLLSAVFATVALVQAQSTKATAPFGKKTTSDGGETPIQCFDVDSRGPLISPKQATKLISLYNSTICSGNPHLFLDAQMGIVISLGDAQLVFKNQLPMGGAPPSCEETVGDFETLLNTCFDGFETYGGKLLEHGGANYVIASTVHSFI